MNSKLPGLLAGQQIVSVTCRVWGDTGKGKFVDFFGGANAGHSISFQGNDYVFHLVPSGILHDSAGKLNVIGNGVAFDPVIFCGELDILDKEGMPYNGMRIAHNAKLVLPQHLVMDRYREKSKDNKVGSTGRGMGPVYQDFASRIGLTPNDILPGNKDTFVRKLRRNLEEKVIILRHQDAALIETIMAHEHLNKGAFWNATNIFDVDAIVEVFMALGERLEPMIVDTDTLMQDSFAAGKRILFEGAQGDLLSVVSGTYPYVTASDCTRDGLATGVGLHDCNVGLHLGITKAYTTRVGKGPLPTELGGAASEAWSDSDKRKTDDDAEYPHASINDPNEFVAGVALRRLGREYGATTGRCRRNGWLDLPLLRYTAGRNGRNLIITKADVLDTCGEIKVCTHYVYDGPDYRLGERVFRKGDRLDKAVPDSNVLAHCQAEYEKLPGWNTSISDVHERKDLPANCQGFMSFVERSAGVNLMIISTGPDREQTIVG
jgi:adenylosuccinate synthase